MSTGLLPAWDRVCRQRARDTAVIETAGGASCTFRDLDARANAWSARHAGDAARRRGTVVVFAVPNGIAWLELFLGMAKLGLVPAALDASEPAGSQQEIARSIRAGAWWNGTDLEPLDRPRRFRPSDACLVKLTSGTTGRPRPLIFNDAQMIADANQVMRTMGIRKTDINYGLVPFGHSYGLGNLTLPLLARGVPLVCGSSPLPQAIAQDFVRWQPTVFPSIPAVYRALAAASLPRSALASLRVAISAGAPLPPETAREFAAKFGCRIHAFYGSSETGGIAYDRTGGATMTGGVGRAMQGVQIRPRRGGGIEVRSPAVFTHGNARRRGGLGCWVPPDNVRIDGRGRLTLLGRRDRTIKIGGRRLNLAEVAARLRRLAGVRDVWVGVRPGAEPVLGAALVCERSAVELRTELLADTAAWKVPKKLATLAEFPLTERGKTDTRALARAVFG